MFKGTMVVEAKQFLVDNIRDGCKCPCCRQYVKLYKLSLNSTMVRALYAIFKAGGHGWVHVPTSIPMLQRSRIYPKLAFWDLAIPKTRIHEEGGMGWWQVTEKGQQFLAGQIQVPKTVFLYNGEALGFDKELIGVEVAAGIKFTVGELLS